MNLDEITPLVLTYNEEANIGRTLAGLAWAHQIVVIDSGSTDATCDMVRARPNTCLIERPFDDHTRQWNFGLEQVRTPWALALDADYVCPPGLVAELQGLAPTHDAYRARFKYCVNGQPLRGTLYPPRVVLFRVGRFRYRQDGHTQLLDVDGSVGELRTVLLHDDRKPIVRWLANQAHYAELEAEKLLATQARLLGWKDRLRRQIVWAPPLTFLYCAFAKGLVLDGWPGIYYSLQRTYAELLLSLKLLNARLGGRDPHACPLPEGEERLVEGEAVGQSESLSAAETLQTLDGAKSASQTPPPLKMRSVPASETLPTTAAASHRQSATPTTGP